MAAGASAGGLSDRLAAGAWAESSPVLLAMPACFARCACAGHTLRAILRAYSPSKTRRQHRAARWEKFELSALTLQYH
jgi:hypothetical protein